MLVCHILKKPEMFPNHLRILLFCSLIVVFLALCNSHFRGTFNVVIHPTFADRWLTLQLTQHIGCVFDHPFARRITTGSKIQYPPGQCLFFIVVKVSAVCDGFGAWRMTSKAASECFIVHAIYTRCFFNTWDLVAS
ncbi:uncharacterized protein EI97DRAFT_142798 [Westerdykella ornata]|uniref:Uncharacterized protein n=1 Tax=Westerdykella ornata TaxID=318751 RepID=A0A6A6JCV7_WESOR|nr:uncharacterized protein EI97DRAFT_142798 [Westerdykella ornata]KAF2274013.1 hypothetical protein EI97DRAFT_142798 [Westerdykella ornata]